MSYDLDVFVHCLEGFFDVFGVVVDEAFGLHEADYEDSDTSFGGCL